jgi:DNA-binding transcriptional ArsR family regulator
MADDVVVMQPGDERAKKIARAMASQTANDIIQAFGERPMTSSEIARLMNIPITTASYHIDNLLDAGLLNVIETRWSKKGREIKVYGLTNQVLIIDPAISDLRTVLQKYAMFFGIVILATLGLWGILPMLLMPVVGDVSAPRAQSVYGGEEKVSAFNAPPADAAGVPAVHDLVMGFFIGACLVLLALLVYELHYWWRTSPRGEMPRKQEE